MISNLLGRSHGMPTYLTRQVVHLCPSRNPSVGRGASSALPNRVAGSSEPSRAFLLRGSNAVFRSLAIIGVDGELLISTWRCTCSYYTHCPQSFVLRRR